MGSEEQLSVTEKSDEKNEDKSNASWHPTLLFFYKSKPKKFRKIPEDPHPYEIILDVHHFKPKEVTVKISGIDTVIVEAKHEEKQDEQGTIFRHFVRRYKICDYYDTDMLKATLSSDGVLKIHIPRITHPRPDERQVAIFLEDAPARKERSKNSESICPVEYTSGKMARSNEGSPEGAPPKKIQKIIEQIKKGNESNS